MKNFILSAVLALAVPSAFADITATASQNQNATASSGSSSGNAFNQRFDSHDSVRGSDLSSAVPNAIAPNLATTLTETCMGSTSFGASGSGFGFSFGTTWRDSACVRRLDARQLSAFGDLPTAREMMCDSDKVREAAKRAGRPCVADGGQPWGIPVAAAPQEQIVPTPEAAAPVVTEQVRE